MYHVLLFPPKTIKGNFDQTVERVTQVLKTEGFGILTEIDLKATLKRTRRWMLTHTNYKILGACNPPFATYKALQAEDRIGTMLPCNIIVQEKITGQIRVSAINPATSGMLIKNLELRGSGRGNWYLNCQK
ncbi:MAG: DUF302 domain-containing protein [Chitinophagaceae bacterium]|nr:DUF302 domain-containing protein [Chitinophagaceae bacterium]